MRYGFIVSTGDPLTVADLAREIENRAMKGYVAENRGAAEAFDIVWEGVTPGDDPDRAAAIVCPFVEAGATWWMESMWTAPNDPETLRERIRQGPPRFD